MVLLDTHELFDPSQLSLHPINLNSPGNLLFDLNLEEVLFLLKLEVLVVQCVDPLIGIMIILLRRCVLAAISKLERYC